MKKSALVRLMPMLLLFTGVMTSAGCSNELSCEGGQKQLPANWFEAKFPLVEGGSVCSYDDGKKAYIYLSGCRVFRAADRYAERLKADGWEFSLAERDRSFFAASKDGKSFTFAFSDCQAMMSKCSRVNVSNTPRP